MSRSHQAVATTERLPARRTSASVFWFCFWLAVVSAICKILTLHFSSDCFPDHWAGRFKDFVVTWRHDVLYALVIGVSGAIMLRLTRSRPFIHRTVWVAFFLVCFASAFYAIASVRIFHYLRTPLTYPLIYIAGNLKNMRSSLDSFVTTQLAVMMGGGLLLYVVLSLVCHFKLPPRPTRKWMIVQLIGLVVIGEYIWMGGRYAMAEWNEREDRRIADNPHWVLVRSCFDEVAGTGSAHLPKNYPLTDLDDFKPAQQRDQEIVQRQPKIKNVVLFVLESVGTQHLQVYGSNYPSTPTLMAERNNSLVYRNCYAHVGLTANSLVALTLSQYPGVTWKECTVERPQMPGTTLAQIVKAQGYRTAIITTADNDYVGMGNFLANRGFDVNWDYRNLTDKEMFFSWGVEDHHLVTGIQKFLDQEPGKPFFVTAWNQQTHHPYPQTPGKTEIDFFKGMATQPEDAWDLGHYLNNLAEADAQLARLFTLLRERGIADETLVVITGDHGEAFGSPHPVWGHGGRVWEENLHVPLILWNPKLFSGTKSHDIDTVAGHVDILPTIAELLGVNDAPSWQGRSVLHGSRDRRAYFCSVNNDFYVGVREANFKYILNGTLGIDELYDLGVDPQEQCNIARQNSDYCRRMRERLGAWVDYHEARK